MVRALIGLFAVMTVAAGCNRASPAPQDPDNPVATGEAAPAAAPGEEQAQPAAAANERAGGAATRDDERIREVRARTEQLRREIEALDEESGQDPQDDAPAP